MKNNPKLWRAEFPVPSKEDNKYSRGHAIVVGGGSYSTGAARLSAVSALRAGAGLVTVICEEDAADIYAAHLTSVMVRVIDSVRELKIVLKDERVQSVLIGPGCGLDKRTKDYVLTALKMGKNIVLDADAITVFSKRPQELISAIKWSKSKVVLTPHEGEFARIFERSKSRTLKTKVADVLAAAKLVGAVVLLKGAETVIANPDGDFVINDNGKPTLATAGSGDVLAGIIAGLIAQGMDSYKAACAGAWLHGAASKQMGYGLIAEDLPNLLPKALDEIIDR